METKTQHKSGANRADKQRAYLLHRRSYSETSIIGNFFTRDYGIIHLLARGAKRKRGDYALLQPALELLLSWSGRSDLKSMRLVELSQRHNIYSGKSLTILMYVNELLVKLLKPFDAHPRLYDSYHRFLCQQAAAGGTWHSSTNKEAGGITASGTGGTSVRAANSGDGSAAARAANSGGNSSLAGLRRFELELFAELGYGVSWDKDYKTEEPLSAERNYVYEPVHGFTKALAQQPSNSFRGADLLQMRDGDYSQPAVEQAGKQLARLILHHLLEHRNLASRKLIIK